MLNEGMGKKPEQLPKMPLPRQLSYMEGSIALRRGKWKFAAPCEDSRSCRRLSSHPQLPYQDRKRDGRGGTGFAAAV